MADNSTGLTQLKKKSLLHATHAYVLVPFSGSGMEKCFK